MIQTIKKKKSFQQIYKSGRRYFSKNLLAIYANYEDINYETKENKEKDILQKGILEKAYSIIVSKKISNKAVERNKIKRRIKEIIKLNVDEFPERKIILFFPKLSTVNMKFSELQNEIFHIYREITKK
ncbi:MAG: ribonuclease P protein component [Bifidobacteriaceae bacterium]|jgi:ribonuclease P protein component|nr:ribonuclease P protein component [Bifidobacteriaceae bacterium]